MTPQQIRAALDDLARWSLKHGIRIDWAGLSYGTPKLTYATGGIGAPYVGGPNGRESGWWLGPMNDEVEAWGCEEHGDKFLNELSNHERLAIVGGRV